MTAQEAIENLYRTFSKYTPDNMHYCDCGCIDPEDVKKLASKKLHVLEEDDFSSYHGSAMYTWGDLNHYKHYLPRILELHHQKRDSALIGLFEVINKLKYAEWETWDAAEVNAIKDFIYADWLVFINKNESFVDYNSFEYYSFFFDLEDLIHVWDLSQKQNALKNFVQFFYSNGFQLFQKGLKINGVQRNDILDQLLSKQDLLLILETEFFKVSENDPEYAQQISVVLQTIEMELKNSNS